MFPKKNLRILLIPLLVLVNVFLLIFWLQGNQKSFKEDQNTTVFPEIQDLQGKNFSFEELKKYFTTLAEKKGAEYAYKVLRVAPVTANTDMHLMGHVVGDVLYKQEGINGIKICTDEFRNACSHSIVVGLLLDKGEAVLPEIAAACRQAPGGTGAYTMCYHGLGHGVLSYTNYNLPKAVSLCQKTGSEEGVQCIGGTIMEMISGGDHDKLTWGKERPNYLKPSDPFFPCMSSFMPDNAKTMCLTYLTPYLWEAVGANVGSPNETDYSKAFALCATLDEPYRDICSGGFGKEFTVLAQNRDIRKIDQMDSAQLLKVYKWCTLAKSESEIKACNSNALSSLYWGGENDRGASIRFCGVMENVAHRGDCFKDLIGQVGSYIKDLDYKKSFCQSLPDSFQKECKNRLLTN